MKIQQLAFSNRAFIVIVCGLGFLSWFSYYQINSLIRSVNRVDHSNRLTYNIEHILSICKDAESDQRGLLLTGDSTLYTVTENYIQRANNSFRSLDSLLAGNPIQKAKAAQYNSAVFSRLNYLDSITDYRFSNSYSFDTLYLLLQESKAKMDKVRILAASLESTERQLLEERVLSSQRSMVFTPLVNLIITFLLLSGIIGSLLINRRRYKDLERMKEELQTVNAELVKSTEEASQTNNQLKLAQRLTQIGSWEWHLASDKVSWSDELYRIYGVSPETFTPSFENFLKSVHPEDQHHIKDSIEKALKDQQSFNFNVRIIRPNGEVRILHEQGQVFTNKKGDTTKLAGTCHDVTVLKAAEKKLQESSEQLRLSEQKFKSLLEYAPDAIVIADEKGVIQLVNLQTESIFSYSRTELIGKKIDVLMPEARTEFDPVQWDKLFDNPQFRSMGSALSLNGKRRDGSEFPIEISLSPLETDEGTFVSFAIRDITLRKKTEDTLRSTTTELEKRNLELERSNAELESFSYIASHDLQEPLRKIKVFTEKLLDTESSRISETGKDYFNRLVSASVRMQHLINDLLNYSRLNTEKQSFRETDLSKIIEEVKLNLSEVIEKKNAVIQTQNLPSIDAIHWQFQQLFSNLIGNSIKYSKQEVAPRICIKAEFLKKHRLAPHEPPRSFWKISLEDNGIGFDPEYNEKIFDLFSRLHGRNEYSGTGIGLSICKRVVENHHGSITAEGSPGNGAIFRIFVPESHADAT